jgi:hypothetical protein
MSQDWDIPSDASGDEGDIGNLDAHSDEEHDEDPASDLARPFAPSPGLDEETGSGDSDSDSGDRDRLS